MCALGRESWVQTPLPPNFYQKFSSHHSRYITLFFKGTYSVIGFYEVMGMFFGWFNAFSVVILGIFEPFSLVLLVIIA